MAVGVTGDNGLKFVAELDTDGVVKGGAKIEAAITKAAKAGVASSKKQSDAIKEQIKATKDATDVTSNGAKKQDLAQRSQVKTAKDLITHYKILAEKAKDIYDKTPNLKIKELDKEIQKMTNSGKKGFNDLGDTVKKTDKDTGGFLNTLKAGVAGIAAYFTFDAIVGFGKQVLGITAEFEKLNAVLANTLGSKGLANMAMKSIVDFASKTPFSVAELTDSFVKLANQGFVPTQKELRQLGDLASSTGKGFDQLAEAILDSMSGENERLKEFGIKARVNGEQVTYTFKGVATTIDNTSASIRAYLTSLGDVAGVSGSMAVISETLTGKISNLGDSWDQMLVSVGSNTSGVFAGAIDIIGRAINKITQFNKELNTQQKYNLDGDLLTKINRGLNPFANKGATSTELQVAGIENAADRVRDFVTKSVEGAKSAKDFSIAILALAKDAKEFSLAPGVAQTKGEIKGIKDQYIQGMQSLRDAANAFINKQVVPSALSPAQIKAAEAARKKLAADHELDLKAAQSLQQKVTDIQNEYTRKSKSKDEEELQAVRDKFAKIAEEVARFNANPKNKIKVNPEGLEKTRDLAIADLTYRQDTERLKIKLDVDKKLYAEYEAYKNNFGADAAKAKYAKELKDSKTYFENLKADYAITFAQGLTGNFTGPIKERLALLKSEIEAETKAQEKGNEALLSEFMTYATKRKIIVEKYLEKERTLRQNGHNEEANLAKAEGIKKANELDDQNFKTLNQLEKLLNDIEQMSVKEARKAIALAQSVVREQLKSGLISVELAKERLNALDSAAEKVDQKLPDALINVANAMDKIVSLVGDMDSGFANVLKMAASVTGELGNAFRAASDFQKFKKANDIGGQLGAGVSMFTAGLAIVQTVNTFLDRQTKADKEREASKDRELRSTEALTKALERQLAVADKAYGTKKIEEYRKAITDAQKVIESGAKALKGRNALTGDKELDKLIDKVNNGQKLSGWSWWGETEKEMYEGYKRGLKSVTTDVKKLQELLDAGMLDDSTAKLAQNFINATDAIAKAKQAMAEFNTASSFTEIADSIVDLFARGNAAAEDFGDNFENIMKKAILNSFKTQSLAKQLQDFYNNFADFSSSDGQLSAGEIGLLRAEYDKIIAESAKKFSDLEKATGISFAPKPEDSARMGNNTLSGAIKGITETQADLLAGRTAAIQMNQIQMLGIANKALVFQEQTAINTNRLHEVVPILKAIQVAAEKNSGVAAANGRTGG